MEGAFADAVAEHRYVLLLSDTDVHSGGLGGFGSTVICLDLNTCPLVGSLLFRDLALPPVHPIHLSCAQLPLIANDGLELGLGQARRQTPTHELQARLSCLRAAGCL
jgi:hypothetical protein